MGTTRTLIILFALILCLLSALPTPLADAAEPAGNRIVLRTAAQESNPKYFKDTQGRMTGLCAEILQAVARRSGIAITGANAFIPFKRLQKYIRDGEMDIFFGFAKSPKRLKEYTFIDHPLYSLNYTVMTLASDTTSITSLDDLRAASNNGVGGVLTPMGSRTEEWLTKKGGVTFDGVGNKLTDCIRMLLRERGGFVFYHEMGLIASARKMGVADKVKILPVSFLSYCHYAAVGKHVPPHVVEQIRTALASLEKDGTLQAIRDKYLSLQTIAANSTQKADIRFQ